MHELSETGLNAKRPTLLVVVLIAGAFYLVGQYIASQPGKTSKEAEAAREVSVQGQAEVDVRPNVARITLGVSTGTQANAATALQILSEKFDAVVAAVREAKVKEEDIRATNISVQPVYDFSDGRQTLRGFEASESIEVTIRELDAIGTVIARSTIEGVNQVGGLSFTVDDPKELEQEVQVAAIEDAHANAKELAKALGVRLGDVKGFSGGASTPPGPPVPLFAQSERADLAVSEPPVPTGTQTITAEVTITYELK